MDSLLSKRHSQTSLTEKGRIRISSHPNSANRHARRRREPIFRLTSSSNEKLLLGIVVGLFLMMCFCFLLAYNLLSSGCVASVVPHKLASVSDLESLRQHGSRHQVVHLDQDQGSLPLDSSTKYISYLPHSGFHNQRIALENALIMARILNRTLLVPPVRLGKGILTYYPFDHLYELVALQGKTGLSHCANVSTWSALPIECSDYYDYTLVPWSWLTNISSLPDGHSTVNRWNMSDAWLSSELGILPQDVFSVKDRTAYQYRFVDADPLDMAVGRFQEIVSTSLLDQLPHKLIQLGTLFGSSRLRLREQPNIAIRTEVREAMTFSNPTLSKLAESIKAKLGGTYLAAHIRVGDGSFERKARKNVRMSYWRLLREELDLSEDDILGLELAASNASSALPPPILHDSSVSHDFPQLDALPISTSTSLLPCRGGSRHNDSRLAALNLPLFISTDAPSTSPHLSLFTQTFPCTFFLSDFPAELGELSRMKSSYDSLMLSDFIISFLDAMVAGNAERVVGTDGSTFSQFVLDVLWRRYHGAEIMQRG